MAKSLVFERYDPENTTHVAAANAIADWQKQDKENPNYEQMFSLGPEVLAKHVFGIICLDIDDETETTTAVGYNAATFAFPGDVFETGAMIVNPAYRGLGMAGKIKNALFEQLAALYPDGCSLITFTNANSEHLNRKSGFVDATAADVPKEALDLCVTDCSRYEAEVKGCGKLCCDTILTRKLGAAAQ